MNEQELMEWVILNSQGLKVNERLLGQLFKGKQLVPSTGVVIPLEVASNSVVVNASWLSLAVCPDAKNAGHKAAYPCQWCDEFDSIIAAIAKAQGTKNV